MGLDDFTGESLSDKEKERREELSQNTPPGDNSKWRHYEPGTPDWLSFISGEEVDNDSDSLTELDRGADEMWGEEALVVNIEGVDSTTLRSTGYKNLNTMR